MFLLKLAGGMVGLYFLINHTTGTIVGIIIGVIGYKFYAERGKLKGVEIDKNFKGNEKGLEDNKGKEKPPYPKLHKPDSTTIHFPKGGNL